MPEPIEKLYVELGADIAPLLKDVNKGVDEGEKKLKDFERTGKRAFDETGKSAKKSTGLINKLKGGFAALAVGVGAVTAALAAMTAGLVAAFQAAERGIASVRIRRAFRSLAASAGQSSDEIIAAMKEASAGTINEMELMRQANLALQLGVAKTPEDFEKLTRSALVLGRSVGRGPVEALDDLINAAGRRSTEVLDNLGISLAEVNSEMETLAQQEFGKAASSLDAAQKNALFMQAALNVADRQAENLGGNVEDVGSGLEAARARAADFQQDVNEGFLIITDSALGGFGKIYELLFGPKGLYPLQIDSANIVQEAFARVLATVAATINTALEGVLQLIRLGKKAATFDLSTEDLAGLNELDIIKNAASTFQEKFDISLNNIRDKYADVFGEGETPAGGESPTETLVDNENENQEKLQEILLNAQTELLDIQEETNERREELTQEHSDTMAEIEAEAVEQRVEAAEELADELADLEKETAQERESIFADTRKELENLAQQSDADLAEERKRTNKEEMRETEDHLRRLRQLRSDFLFNLEDAVKSRDARRVVDLRRQFERDQQREERQFQTRRQREKEDASERLAEIKRNEDEAARAILERQQEALATLDQQTAERRAKLQERFDEEIARIDETEAEKLAREQSAFEQRQAELESALAERLDEIAKGLAAEDDINREGAEKILSTLAEFFGEGGKIPELMNSFETRARQRMQITVDFDRPDELQGRRRRPGSGRGSRAGRAGSIPSFQHGGTLLATRPTLAQFGEVPELVQFTPLSKMGSMGGRGGGGKMEVEITHKGTAPPGIGVNERDKIAGVLVNALREAGVNVKPGR